jgi:hypothetical protein
LRKRQRRTSIQRVHESIIEPPRRIYRPVSKIVAILPA